MAMATSTSAALSFARSSSLTGTAVSCPSSVRSSSPAAASLPVVCRSQKSDLPPPAASSRRVALSLLAAIAAASSSRTSPAEAAYGEAANIFGAPKKDTGFVSVSGEGFKLNVPSKWNPSKEAEFPGTVLRYEDNFDAESNVSVMIVPAEKPSIKDYGSPEKFLESVSYLLGRQSYSGKTQSEGGFDPNAVATASILESSTPTVDGKDYYVVSVLTRTADGNEGGKHQLIVGSISGGKLFICKAQAGDKRWFKGAKKFVEGAVSSFSVA